jgi:hypothetical protein
MGGFKGMGGWVGFEFTRVGLILTRGEYELEAS